MNGSEKQIKWATEIKELQMPLIEAGIQRVLDKIAADDWGYDESIYDEMRTNLSEYKSLVGENENVSFWIDTKGRDTAKHWEQAFYNWESMK